ncbi:serine protease [Kitasatospora sp. NBC_00240]|uniref:trypsin-like serine peptidase n=1 Tax=Kitasatospora sp. NBC_00240 TaxID=2903567 RepID=UPI002252F065|nr:serine protease [Kitasatospora sp. NBC_00240]MCX5210802.1 serine protease [Kitasatospora sp. NBC_00240]
MGQHRAGQHARRKPPRRRILRPALATACAALAVAAVLAGTHALTSRATAAAPHATSADTEPTTSAGPSTALAPAAAATTQDPPTPQEAASGSPTPAAVPVATATATVKRGTTADAPADAESAKVGALFNGPVAAGGHFCTASVVHSPTRNLLLTAAHCLSSSGDVTFAPGYRDGSAPYGSWKVTAVHTTTGWDQHRDQDEDFAILEVAADQGREIEDVVGAHPLGTGESFSAQVRLLGYPNAGETPLTCVNATSREDTYQRAIDCPDYTGGTSGGPWISTATGAVIGLIGGYQEGGDTPDTSYSALFDHTITALYATAVAAAG